MTSAAHTTRLQSSLFYGLVISNKNNLAEISFPGHTVMVLIFGLLICLLFSSFIVLCVVPFYSLLTCVINVLFPSSIPVLIASLV